LIVDDDDVVVGWEIGLFDFVCGCGEDVDWMSKKKKQILNQILK